jgi:uncharacterized protein YqeY
MLRDDINNAVKDAMEGEGRAQALHAAHGQFDHQERRHRRARAGKPPLSDADLLGVFQKMIKQRQESVELYDKGGRAELGRAGARGDRDHLALLPSRCRTTR